MITDTQKGELSKYFATQPIAVAYLFGSQATGKISPQSDVDIAVLFDTTVVEKNQFDLRLKMIGECMSILHRDDVEVVPLNNAPIALQFSAIYPREYLYIKNNEKRAVFEADVMSRYFDYQYYIQQNTKYGIRAFARG